MRARRSHSIGQRGFTVTELLVALTVTVIGLAGLLSLHVTTVRGNASVSRALEASTFAEEALESLRQKSIGEIEALIVANGGNPIDTSQQDFDIDFGSPPEVFGNAIVDGRAGQQYRKRFYVQTVSATQPQLVRIRAEILWREGEAPPSHPLDLKFDHQLIIETVRARIEAL